MTPFAIIEHFYVPEQLLLGFAPGCVYAAANVWTYDFMEDATADGRKLRLLTIVGEFSTERSHSNLGYLTPNEFVEQWHR